jgi:hypothetical protein
MSTWNDVDVRCPHCGHSFVAQVASGLHISRLPAVRERIIEGRLHRFDCARCRGRVEVRVPLIYADFQRGHWIEVWPVDEIRRWRELAIACEASFHRVIERGAPILREQVKLFRVRIVFGYDELREKLLLWDAELDDVAIECVKLLAIRRDVSLVGPSDRLLVTKLDGDTVTIARYRGDVVDATFDVTLRRDELATIRAQVDPALERSDPFTSISRVIGDFATAS